MSSLYINTFVYCCFLWININNHQNDFLTTDILSFASTSPFQSLSPTTRSQTRIHSTSTKLVYSLKVSFNYNFNYFFGYLWVEHVKWHIIGWKIQHLGIISKDILSAYSHPSIGKWHQPTQQLMKRPSWTISWAAARAAFGMLTDPTPVTVTTRFIYIYMFWHVFYICLVGCIPIKPSFFLTVTGTGWAYPKDTYLYFSNEKVIQSWFNKYHWNILKLNGFSNGRFDWLCGMEDIFEFSSMFESCILKAAISQHQKTLPPSTTKHHHT